MRCQQDTTQRSNVPVISTDNKKITLLLAIFDSKKLSSDHVLKSCSMSQHRAISFTCSKTIRIKKER